eukprot:1513163-Rhodomonas_salina.3
MRLLGDVRFCPVRCPVLAIIFLRVCYTLSGTDYRQFQLLLLRSCYKKPGTETRYGATRSEPRPSESRYDLAA